MTSETTSVLCTQYSLTCCMKECLEQTDDCPPGHIVHESGRAPNAFQGNCHGPTNYVGPFPQTVHLNRDATDVSVGGQSTFQTMEVMKDCTLPDSHSPALPRDLIVRFHLYTRCRGSRTLKSKRGPAWMNIYELLVFQTVTR